MNNLKELSQQLNKLYIGDYVKINIHFNIEGSLLKLCENINQNINRHTLGLIHFGAKYITAPHISVFMGYINSYEQFELILQEVSEYANKAKSFRIDPTQLYFKSLTKTSPKYLFLDLLQNEEIAEQKQYFNNLLINRIKPMEWDFLKEPPHITLGCYENISNTLIKETEKYHIFPFSQIEHIGVSIAGKKGVCLGNLKSFKLL